MYPHMTVTVDLDANLSYNVTYSNKANKTSETLKTGCHMITVY